MNQTKSHSGILKPIHAAIRPHRLATRFGVSRPTIREALKRLAAQHLIRSRRGPAGGNFVTSPTLSDAAQSLANATTLMVAVGEMGMDEILVVRFEFESICCRLACQNRRRADLDAMNAEIEAQKQEMTDSEFCAADVRFHRALVNASGNSVLKFLMYSLVEALQPVTNMMTYRIRDRKEIIAMHERIYSAIKDRKPDQAISSLSELVDYTRDVYQKAALARKSR